MADRTITYRFRGDASGLKSATRSAGNDVRGLGMHLQQAGRHTDTLGRKARRLIPSFGAGMAALGVGKLIKDSVTLEASFSKTLRQVAIATGAPKSAMKGLHDEALKMGAQTVFSANESAGAMLELAKAGISTRDIMGGGLKGTLTLAAAGGLELGNAATIASNAMNMFSLHGKDMGSIAAALAGGAQASTASVESLGMALSQVGPGAKNAGLSLQETVGVLSEFDQYGVKGSDAGTSLKTMLTRLVPTTKQAQKAMSALGLSFVDSKGNIDGITTVAQKLHDKLGPLTQAQRIQALTTIFGSDATRAATILMDHGAKGLAKFIKATKDQGAAQKMANANMQGTAGALEQLSGSWETAKLKLGEALAPTIQKGARYLSSTALPAITKFIGQMQSGKGTGGAVARDLGTIYNAAKKVVDIGGQVARAFDGLPSGLKKAIAIGGISALAANKLGLIGRGSVGGAIAKSVMGGVQKVFVVNAGFGKGGLGGAAGAAEAGAVGRGAAVGAAAKSIALRAGAVYLAGGALSQFNFGAKGVKGDARAVLNSTKHPGATALDQKLSAPFGGDALTRQIANMKKLDAAIAKVQFSKPAAGAKMFRDVMRKTGLSSAELSRVLPRTASAMQAVSRGGKSGTASLNQLLGGAARTAGALKRSGLSAKEFGRRLQTLPKGVRTKVTTPGAIKSAADIQRLAARYKLTPKQVRTLASLVDHATGPAKKAQSVIDRFGRSHPRAAISVNDAASGVVRAAMGVLASFNGRHATSYIETVHVNKYVNQGNPSQAKPRGNQTAIGGRFEGIRGIGIPRVIGEAGPEAVVPLDRPLSQVDPSVRLLSAFAQGKLEGMASGGRSHGTAQIGTAVSATRKPESIAHMFNLFGGMSVKAVSSEFAQLAKRLHGLGPHLRGLEGAAKKVAHAYNEQEKQLKSLRSKANSLSSTTKGTFQNDPFGNGLTGLGDVLQQDKMNALNMASSLQKLKHKGISRGLEAALAASGDSGTAMELAKLSRSQINRYDALYAQRNKAADYAGDVAARTTYGASIRHLDRTVARLNHKLEGLEKAAERGTANGTRKGMNDKSRASARNRRVKR